MKKYVALVGLGAVGAPLADLLRKRYDDDFILLSSDSYLQTLKNIHINGEKIATRIVSKKGQLKKRIGTVFICVKNYQIDTIASLLLELIDQETIIVPLQNGVYSYDFFRKEFPNNIVLEGFAQGPNTSVLKNIFVYQKPGSFKIGSSLSKWKKSAEATCTMMKEASIDCTYVDDIKTEVWKKLMLNVAGNAVTALTGIDYCMFEKSPETQKICEEVMNEFTKVAFSMGVIITNEDIEKTINYFLSFKITKKTSMLEDVINCRPTENEFIAGYISRLAKEKNVSTPHIDSLYMLMKIKEDVYMHKL